MLLHAFSSSTSASTRTRRLSIMMSMFVVRSHTDETNSFRSAVVVVFWMKLRGTAHPTRVIEPIHPALPLDLDPMHFRQSLPQSQSVQQQAHACPILRDSISRSILCGTVRSARRATSHVGSSLLNHNGLSACTRMEEIRGNGRWAKLLIARLDGGRISAAWAGGGVRTRFFSRMTSQGISLCHFFFCPIHTFASKGISSPIVMTVVIWVAWYLQREFATVSATTGAMGAKIDGGQWRSIN
ncbi:unnamed protein product [Mycena citricolor]|nr:unnamed protein product [Mycena citricolor]